MITIDDFLKVEIRVGSIEKVELNSAAKHPAYKLWINFGHELGVKRSSAKITDFYTEESLLGKQILAVTNLEPRRVAGFKSEVLVLGIVLENEKVILLNSDKKVKDGLRVF